MNALKAIARFTLRWLKRFAYLIIALLVFIALASAAAYWWLDENVLSTLPSDLSSFKNYRPPTSCQVFAANGAPIDRFYLERRIWVPLADLPDIVPRAFIAAEDRRFMEHSGVDWQGILRALWTNLRSGRSRQGGSTITQQLVKNLIVGKQRSYVRKLKEAALAIRLEKELKKAEILELYLNYVALGSGNFGVEAAAQDYFGISSRDLDTGQAAMLAGLVPAPSRYSPRASIERAQRRRELVLQAMIELGELTEEQAQEYLDDPVLVPRERTRERRVGVAYATEVRRELRRVLSTEVATSEGIKVYTALDLELETVTEDAVRDAARALEARQGRMGAVRHIAREDRESFLLRPPGIALDPQGKVVEPKNGDCFEALVPDQRDLRALEAGPWRFTLAEEERAVKVRPKNATLEASVTAGDVLRVCLEDGARVRLDPRPWSEGAAVVIENATGRVIALSGGLDVAIEGFVRATQARRQPGSSFKPYVYAAALLDGKTQLDKVIDGPLALPAGGGKVWSPQNYDGKFFGVVTLRRALTLSLNTVAVRLTLAAGVDDVVHAARLLGVKSPLRKDPTIALGSNEVTLMEQAVAYSTIAREGVRLDPVYIDRVIDVRGREVARAGGEVLIGDEHYGHLPGGPGSRVLSSGIAYELLDMMREVVKRGTARAAFKPGFDRAGKTGTTNGFVDAWFVGFTPRYTIAVWIGTDGTETLGDKETGGRTALPAWMKIADALPHVEGERFPIPDDAMLIRSESEWVALARGHVPNTLLARGTIDETQPLPYYDEPPFRYVPPPPPVETSTQAEGEIIPSSINR